MATEFIQHFAIVAALTFAASCSDRTVIVVDLRAEGLRAPQDIDRVELAAMGDSGYQAMGSFAITSLPQSLAIRPGGGMRGAVVVRARAFHGAEWVGQRVQSARFIDGASARVDVVFEASCRGVVCSADCAAGRCVGDPPDGSFFDAGDVGVDAVSDVRTEVALDAPDSAADTSDSADPADSADGQADAAIARTGLVINEVDYDQAGDDTAEFIELFNASSQIRSLDGVVVFAINGADGLPYANWVLSGTLAPGAFVLIYGPSLTPPPGTTAIPMFQASVLQNGNEGIVLFDTRTNTPIDTLAYGLSNNTLRATVQGTTFELVEGTRATARDSSSQIRSMVRLPNGTDTNDASVDWLESTNPSPAALNLP